VRRGLASDLRAVAFAECGHLCQEERPDVVNEELLSFLEGWSG
jgi:haloacetate dehalogenase